MDHRKQTMGSPLDKYQGYQCLQLAMSSEMDEKRPYVVQSSPSLPPTGDGMPTSPSPTSDNVASMDEADKQLEAMGYKPVPHLPSLSLPNSPPHPPY